MDLNRSELPDEIKRTLKEDTVKKIMYNEKAQMSQQTCSRNA